MSPLEFFNKQPGLKSFVVGGGSLGEQIYVTVGLSEAATLYRKDHIQKGLFCGECTVWKTSPRGVKGSSAKFRFPEAK